jgi:hypothetical protein
MQKRENPYNDEDPVIKKINWEVVHWLLTIGLSMLTAMFFTTKILSIYR